MSSVNLPSVLAAYLREYLPANEQGLPPFNFVDDISRVGSRMVRIHWHQSSDALGYSMWDSDDSRVPDGWRVQPVSIHIEHDSGVPQADKLLFIFDGQDFVIDNFTSAIHVDELISQRFWFYPNGYFAFNTSVLDAGDSQHADLLCVIEPCGRFANSSSDLKW